MVIALFFMGLATGAWRHHGGWVLAPCWLFCSCMACFPLQVRRMWKAQNQQQIVPSAGLIAAPWNALQPVESLALANVIFLQCRLLTTGIQPLISPDKSYPARQCCRIDFSWGMGWALTLSEITLLSIRCFMQYFSFQLGNVHLRRLK